MTYKFGRIPDLKDIRDEEYKFRAPRALIGLPESVDNRGTDFGIDDQGQLGSCVGHATEGAYRNLLRKSEQPDFDGSRLALYYAARAREGTTKIDNGCMIRTAVKVVNKTGIVPTELWPYIESKFARRPPKAAYAAAKQRITHQYQSVDNTDWTAVKAAVAMNANLIIGFTVYDSFVSDEVAANGQVPMPQHGEKVQGGHAMRAVGYTPTHLIVANSWSPQWGDRGYCYMPREFITNKYLCDDFWTLTQV